MKTLEQIIEGLGIAIALLIVPAAIIILSQGV